MDVYTRQPEDGRQAFAPKHTHAQYARAEGTETTTLRHYANRRVHKNKLVPATWYPLEACTLNTQCYSSLSIMHISWREKDVQCIHPHLIFNAVALFSCLVFDRWMDSFCAGRHELLDRDCHNKTKK